MIKSAALGDRWLSRWIELEGCPFAGVALAIDEGGHPAGAIEAGDLEVAVGRIIVGNGGLTVRPEGQRSVGTHIPGTVEGADDPGPPGT